MVWVAETVGEDGRSGVRWVGYVAWGVVRRTFLKSGLLTFSGFGSRNVD